MKFQRIKVATFDERGTISDILYNGSFQHAAIIRTNPAKDGRRPVIRGNHYHKQSIQHIYILDGSLTYWWQEVSPETWPDGGKVYLSDRQNIHVPKGCMVSTPPFEVHTLEIWEPTTFIVFTDGPRGGHDYESDTFRVPAILTAEDAWKRH